MVVVVAPVALRVGLGERATGMHVFEDFLSYRLIGACTVAHGRYF